MIGQLVATPLIVFFGGFGSCFFNGHPSEIQASANIHEFANSVNDSLAESLEVPRDQVRSTVIKTCYAIGNRTVYSSYYHPESRSHSDVGQSSLEELFQWIDANGRGRPVILIGQSHGGWTAMKAAANLTTRINLLATIDPISVKNCHAGAFSASTTGYATAGFEPWRGCTEAPTDFGAEQSSAIRENTLHWINFYQLETRFLHSSSIVEADENVRLRFGRAPRASTYLVSIRNSTEGSWNPFQAHAATETSPYVWERITNLARQLNEEKTLYLP